MGDYLVIRSNINDLGMKNTLFLTVPTGTRAGVRRKGKVSRWARDKICGQKSRTRSSSSRGLKVPGLR